MDLRSAIRDGIRDYHEQESALKLVGFEILLICIYFWIEYNFYWAIIMFLVCSFLLVFTIFRILFSLFFSFLWGGLGYKIADLFGLEYPIIIGIFVFLIFLVIHFTALPIDD
jgi:hypothetical protein